MSDPFAERIAAVRLRFSAKLDVRIDGISHAMPQFGRTVGPEELKQSHQHAHDLCGVGPILGYVGTAKVARAIEQVLLAAIKAKRQLTDEEVVGLRSEIAVLRSTATTEMNMAGEGIAS